jgi:hypothetical protein
MDNESFKEYLADWKISPNLSNQNFHNKLIRSLALSHDIDVISVRSINKHFKRMSLNAKIVREGNIFWKYPLVKRNRIDKFFKLFKRIENITMHDSELIFVDVLNLSLLKNALKYKERHNMPIIGVCTDSPNNISFLKKRYKQKLIELGQKLDGYIVLTENINSLYNVNNKPYVCIDGVSETPNDYLPREITDNYIYFGGSLMKEYGVLNLIEAFKKLERNDLKLVICGHHLQKNELIPAIEGHDNIIYLGPVSYERNLSLEKYSLLAVNPRPQNSKIDLYSFPSKTLEFLANGCITITVENELLKDHYGSCIVWSKTGDPDDLLEAMKKALEMTRTEREVLIILGKNKAMQYTSLESVNRVIDDELLSKILLD